MGAGVSKTKPRIGMDEQSPTPGNKSELHRRVRTAIEATASKKATNGNVALDVEEAHVQPSMSKNVVEESPQHRRTYIQGMILEREKLDRSRKSRLVCIYDSAKPSVPLNGLVEVPFHHLTGLMDENDQELLRLSLYLAAGRPGDGNESSRPFAREDRATWTYPALQRLQAAELGELQQFSGFQYNPLIRMPINLLKLDSSSTNNVVPFSRFCYPTDKYNLSHGSGQLVEFQLDAEAFQSGNIHNSVEQLQELKGLLFGMEAVSSYKLLASPLHCVTLPDAARLTAGIPPSARFYAFFNPVLCTDKPTSIKKNAMSEVALDRLCTAKDTLSRSKSGISSEDPFVSWLCYGAYVYFDFKFDIVAINALCFEECASATAAIFFGEPSRMPTMAIEPLFDLGRWWPLTADRMRSCGFTHFTWILPSEFLGDSIFTASGGFAYLHEDDYTIETTDSGETHLQVSTGLNSRYYPVVRNEQSLPHSTKRRDLGDGMTVPEEVNKRDLHDLPLAEALEIVRLFGEHDKPVLPLTYNAPLTINELLATHQGRQGLSGEKYFPSAGPAQALFAAGEKAAHGLAQALGYTSEGDLERQVAALCQMQPGDAASDDFLEKLLRSEMERISGETIRELRSRYEGSVFLVSGETEEAYAAEVRSNATYVLDESAVEEVVAGNDGGVASKDTGHGGWDLNDFCMRPQAVGAHLSRAEVAALRLYTSSTFRLINGPLRCYLTPHPLALTTLLISRALKKLRANHMQQRKFLSRYLWRGMKDLQISEKFLLRGGAEMACMSTSNDIKVVAGYARSKAPLIFRIKVDSPMELGADISWLSIFPGEAEVLYPPLTYLKPMFKQQIKDSDGIVVTVKPSFPS